MDFCEVRQVGKLTILGEVIILPFCRFCGHSGKTEVDSNSYDGA